MCDNQLTELRDELQTALDKFNLSKNSIDSLLNLDKGLEIKETTLIELTSFLLPKRDIQDLELFIIEDKENIISMLLSSTLVKV